MWELVKAGGVLMLPLVICSIAMCAIIIERSIRLRLDKIAPASLMTQINKHLRADTLNSQAIAKLKQNSILGDMLATGLESRTHGFQFSENQMQTRANELIHQLEVRYPGKFQERYLRGKVIQIDTAEELLEEAAKTQGLLGKEGVPQTDNMARMILSDFRQGRLGPISFEVPEERK